MFSNSGQLVLQQQINEGTRQHILDVSKLTAGVYIIQLQTGDEIQNFRFVKQ
jgi:hypothetical protein